ncbi:MAG: DUF4389 domain-containing protein [Dehalococcoidia bacterium]|nr:DUF4389 domain-containing protein [Dehalococcoidia bacterium]MSQ17740.1 DUF4389 domain-containing protein [Dehalococcoidia bacterium]
MTTPAPYPVTLDAQLSPTLSRWLWLVKWLLAIPHYLLFGLSNSGLGGVGTLLALFAQIAHLFTGRYPTSLFDLALGIERWGFRVAAYAMLMRDEYPPFRLSP